MHLLPLYMLFDGNWMMLYVMQDTVDDSARAAGLAAGHVQSSVEGVLDQVDASVHQLKEKTAAVAENVHVPPAEMTTTTEDLLRQRQGAGEA
jgi:hypothetical protein